MASILRQLAKTARSPLIQNNKGTFLSRNCDFCLQYVVDLVFRFKHTQPAEPVKDVRRKLILYLFWFNTVCLVLSDCS